MIGARYIEKNSWARVDMEFLFECLTGPSGYQPCLTLNAARCVYNTLIEPILCYTDTTWGELQSPSVKPFNSYKIVLPSSIGVTPLKTL